jgi:hypothetical protein
MEVVCDTGQVIILGPISSGKIQKTVKHSRRYHFKLEGCNSIISTLHDQERKALRLTLDRGPNSWNVRNLLQTPVA